MICSHSRAVSSSAIPEQVWRIIQRPIRILRIMQSMSQQFVSRAQSTATEYGECAVQSRDSRVAADLKTDAGCEGEINSEISIEVDRGRTGVEPKLNRSRSGSAWCCSILAHGYSRYRGSHLTPTATLVKPAPLIYWTTADPPAKVVFRVCLRETIDSMQPINSHLVCCHLSLWRACSSSPSWCRSTLFAWIVTHIFSA